MRLIIGAIVAVVGGIALASGVTVAVNLSSAPDKGINIDEARTPDPWAGATNYGTP
ncbi:MAG TPA: hypothetical protein VFV67_32570 [Actinophytocola sp.]|uniref:hypothetical protein n=1 Tax=Actinophytocola sp. TaxID=1872138 RepID=UPI002DBE244B|nr:hypothetical protein [Actinophytocola sp.]HEU5475403.1 hypothetical protein [Actinophytocola sp.]